jgi:hypothetical protein
LQLGPAAGTGKFAFRLFIQGKGITALAALEAESPWLFLSDISARRVPFLIKQMG